MSERTPCESNIRFSDSPIFIVAVSRTGTELATNLVSIHPVAVGLPHEPRPISNLIDYVKYLRFIYKLDSTKFTIKLQGESQVIYQGRRFRG